MTCKECIHYDVCEALESNGISKVYPSQCGCYKPKSRFVELPCEVGQTVYAITTKRPCYACCFCADSCHKDCSFEDQLDLVVKKAKVCSVEIKKINNVLIEFDEEKTIQSYKKTYWFEDFGKTVFLTKEEAEKALAERNKK